MPLIGWLCNYYKKEMHILPTSIDDHIIGDTVACLSGALDHMKLWC